MRVKPKKSLGQHFLKDENIAERIVEALTAKPAMNVLEIGPGTGVLTKYLLNKEFQFKAIDLDTQSIDYLRKNYPLTDNLIRGDFLKMAMGDLFQGPISIIGNFPYNISSQIFFKVLDHRDQVDEVVCMLQREVADRIVSPPGNRTYGILSVLLQCYYDAEKLFDVAPEVFDPPPKVWSSVIRLKRNQVTSLDCDEKLFKKVVKMGFQMRRKTLRNALKGLNLPAEMVQSKTFDKRAEQLSVSDYEHLTQLIESNG
ncbi:MAG: 16S rRNA (adenine(1518)-N(6)/adenine(1519)-N(6))-dimethyltransferase RsmA [Bacteroidota bacterium]